MLLKASHLLTPDGDFLSPALIHIAGDCIQSLGDQPIPNEPVIDLGSMALLPGFVNAHCHLELTGLGPLSLPAGSSNFVGWIGELIHQKSNFDSESAGRGIQNGIQLLTQSGVTTVGDHLSFNAPWREIARSPLRGKLFGEVLGIAPEISRGSYRIFLGMREELKRLGSLFELIASPHSVHAVDPAVLKEIMAQEPAPLSCHLAESREEEQYFSRQSGALHEFIQKRGIQPPHRAASAIQYLRREGLPTAKILVIHGNYLSPEDLALIRRENLSIVHCPGSHAYFGHPPFPLKAYLDQGINIALGTDSIASNRQLNFPAELRLVREKHSLPFKDLIALATINGAKALRMEREIGSIEPGKKADVIGFAIAPNQSAPAAVLNANRVSFAMINGKVLIPPPA